MSTVRIQLRRGLASEWAAADLIGDGVVLAPGEVGFITDENTFKVGNGDDKFGDLPYILESSLGDYIPMSQFGTPSGVATLDSNGILNVSQLPALAKVTVASAANQAARLALTAEPGDIAIQADNGQSYVLKATPASTDSNWQALVGSEAVVDTVEASLVAGTGLDKTYNDAAGTITIDIDSTVTTNSGSQTLTNKTLGSSTALGANLDAATYKITNLGAPTNSTDAATKAYVDAVSEGLHIHEAADVYVASNVTIATALEAGDTVDNITLTAGMRILVNGQTTKSQNGIYVVQSSGGPTRALDFDTALEVASGDFIFVSSGDLYGNTGWVQTKSPATIGTDEISFTQFSGAGTYTAGSGLTLTGTVFSVDTTPSSGFAGLEVAANALNVKVNTADGLEVTSSGLGINNGAGLTFSSGALVLDTANGYGVRKYAVSVGDGSATSYTVTHNLGTKDLTVHVYDNSSPYAQVETDVEHAGNNTVTIRFATAPTSNQYRVVVVG